MSKARCKISNSVEERRGFALIVALTLMAFLVLLMSGLLALMSIETQVATSKQRKLQARSNALLGLQTAIGQLQQFAGPDQRITASASLLDTVPSDHSSISGVENPHWVGVWRGHYGRDAAFNQNFDRKAEVLTWLVSGNEFSDSRNPNLNAVDDSLSPTAKNVVTIVRKNGSIEKLEDEVRVIKSPVGMSGAYAYWVADEGVKAKINPTDDRLLVGSESATQPMINLLNLGSSPRPGIEFLEGMDTFKKHFDKSSVDLIGVGDLALVDKDFFRPSRNLFHDISPHSFGVLSDPAQGGLKRDLSFAFELDDEMFLKTEFAGDYHLNNPGEDFAVSFLYHEPISNHDNRKVRGPTWHYIRDFYRLYKEVENAGNAPVIEARTLFPNVPEVDALGIPSAKNHGPVESYQKKNNESINDYIDESYESGGNTIILANSTKVQVMPVLNRLIYYFYLDIGPDPNNPTDGDVVRLIYNPAIVLWNPYNVGLEFEALLLETRFLPLHLKIHVRGDHPDDDSSHVLTVAEAMAATVRGERLGDYGFIENVGGGSGSRVLKGAPSYINFIVNKSGSANSTEPVYMEPGEIKVFSITNNLDVVGFQEKIYTGEGWSVSGGASVTRLKPVDRVVTVDGVDRRSVRYDPIILDNDGSIESFEMTPAGSNMTISLMDINTVDDPHRQSLDISLDNVGRNIVPEAWGASIRFFTGDEDATGELQTRGPFTYQDLIQIKQAVGVVDIFLKSATEEQYPNELFGFGNFRSLRSNSKNAGLSLTDSYRWGFWGIRYHNSNHHNDIFLQMDDNNAFWGEGYTFGNGSTHVVNFEVPTFPIVSLGSLQHLDISPSAYNPAYAIGYSLASPLFNTNEWIRLGHDGVRTTWDVSLLANRSLWDRYFFSSIAPEVDYSSLQYEETKTLAQVADALSDGDDIVNLRNGRMHFRDDSRDALRDDLFDGTSIDPESYRVIANHLMLDGAFNVNSTSVEAWKSLLMSTSGATVSMLEPGSRVKEESNDRDEAIVSRFSLPAGENGAEWTGYHALTETEAEQLADRIVTEVKNRGPFLSLADFVNRRLVNDETGLKGVLQTAIDEVNVNDEVIYEDNIYTDAMSYPENVAGHTGRGIAGYTMQGDLLTPIASQISVRSDTFVVRSYGEARDPLTDEIVGEAWCEAVVQRFPDFLDDSNPAHTPMDATEADSLGMAPLTNLNKDFGRAFRIVSFRWLNRNEV